MLIITKEKEQELERYGFCKIGEGSKRYWICQLYENLAVKVVPYSVVGQLNNISVIRFVPSFEEINPETVDYDQLDAMVWDFEMWTSKGIMSLIDSFLTSGILEHTDDVTSFARKSA